MQSSVNDLTAGLRFADLLDIAITACLIYLLVRWLRSRAARALGVATLGLATLFIVARWLDLYLTNMFFHYGIIGILLTLIVVFQYDIRLAFERLAASRWLGGHSRDLSSRSALAMTVDTVFHMAKNNIGALLVFPGQQPLERHIHGGVRVDAIVSEPLLLSIFHPASPGHDGAVIVAQNRICWLGLRLPLTRHVGNILYGGTRHAAALGLSERCDAMVVVVSEERGTVSIAHESKISIVNQEELSSQLSDFMESDSRATSRQLRRRCANLLTVFFSIIAATALWTVFAYHTDTVQRTYVVPVEYRNLPAEFEIAGPKPTFVEATLSGPAQAFTLLDPTSVRVSLHIDNASALQRMQWRTADNLYNIPDVLQIEQVQPETIVISVRSKSSTVQTDASEPP